MTAPTNNAAAAFTIIRIVMETIVEAGDLGAPSGPLYAALMTQGCTYQQYTELMDGLTWVGLLRLSHHCYHATEKGRQFVQVTKH
jgi:hypothetical protein